MDLKNLHERVSNNDFGNTRRLLANGVDVNLRDTAGRTPLHHAAQHGLIRMCDLLCLNGALLQAMDKHGKGISERAPVSARTWFWATKHREALRQTDPAAGMRDAAGRTELHWAALEDDAGRVRKLLGAGADPSVADNWGRTPLYYAAMVGSADTAKALADKSATAPYMTDCINQAPYMTDCNYETVIQAAMYGRNAAVLRMLVSRDGSIGGVHRVDRNGENALMTAARVGWAEGVRAMVRAGLQVTDNNNAGDTALHHAAAGGHADAYHELVKFGADPSMTTGDGENVLDLAVNALSLETVSAVLGSWLRDETDRMPRKWITQAVKRASRQAASLSNAARIIDRRMTPGSDPGPRSKRVTILLLMLDTGSWPEEDQALLAAKKPRQQAPRAPHEETTPEAGI